MSRSRSAKRSGGKPDCRVPSTFARSPNAQIGFPPDESRLVCATTPSDAQPGAVVVAGAAFCRPHRWLCVAFSASVRSSHEKRIAVHCARSVGQRASVKRADTGSATASTDATAK